MNTVQSKKEKRYMVIVKIWGGLGNQLFQYVFGQYISRILCVDAYYDVKTNIHRIDITKRNFDLVNYNISLNILGDELLDNKSIKKNEIYNSLRRNLYRYTPFLFKNYFQEKSYHAKIDNENIKDNYYYEGYWQSKQYPQFMRDILLANITLKEAPSRSVKSTLTQIDQQQAVSVHIRRGDYLTIQSNTRLFYQLSKDYYMDAIDYIKTKVGDCTFYFFSDDIDWVKGNFDVQNAFFVEGNKAYIDLILMSSCKHNIIANSTFSWWGAWLNQNKEKIVISPKNWYLGKNNLLIDNLIPNEWIRI